MEGQLVLKIVGSSFSATLDFSNDKLITFSIDYNAESEKFSINGADIVISIGGYHYVPEKKDLLKDFNETVMKKYKDKIAKISESEAKQLLLELLDYINSVTKGGAIALIEKVKNAVKSENVNVYFSLENYTFQSTFMEREFEGIDKLGKGTLLLILVVPIVIGSEFLLLVAPLLSVIVSFIGVILVIIGALNIRGGFKILDELARDVGIGSIGVSLYLVSLIPIVIGAIYAVSVDIFEGQDIMLIGEILVVIANILVGLGFYKVGEEYKEKLTKIGGILVAIPIVSFIGYILVYVGLGKVKSMKNTSHVKP